MKIDPKRLAADLEPERSDLAATLERAGWGVERPAGAGNGLVALKGVGTDPPARLVLAARAGSGLAVLVELARAATPRLLGRLELVLAVPGDPPDALARWLAGACPGRPTLVLALDRPGAGPMLRIVGRGEALALARRAAEDLRIPHRAGAGPLGGLLDRSGRRPFARRGLAAVTLTGSDPARPVDPAQLGAAAQLAAELCLRWARRHEASVAKSAQKPG